MRPFSFKIDGHLFRSVYSVYLVVIEHVTEGMFYYVGQTGDSAHLTAQSPFYRMGGHFRNGVNATDNQIIKSLAKKAGIEFTKENRYEIEAWLTDCTVQYHIFPVHEYEYSKATEKKETFHTPFKRDTLVIESMLIKELIGEYGRENVLNEKIGCSFEVRDFHRERLKDIIEYLGVRL